MVNNFYFQFIILNFVDFRLIITCFGILRIHQIAPCVCAGSPPYTCLSVGMNAVMHSAFAQASVRLSVCFHALACVHPFACVWI